MDVAAYTKPRWQTGERGHGRRDALRPRRRRVSPGRSGGRPKPAEEGEVRPFAERRTAAQRPSGDRASVSGSGVLVTKPKRPRREAEARNAD